MKTVYFLLNGHVLLEINSVDSDLDRLQSEKDENRVSD